MSEKKQKITRICGYDEDRIMIRGEDLVNDLMGKLGFTEMILFHLFGKKPSAMQTIVADAVLVTIMEHGLIPSAIASRLTLLGAPESFQGAVAAGLLGVGDRYAGTASECAKILDEIVAADENDREECTRRIIRDYRGRKQPLPGFGHPIHRGGDPRVPRLIEIARSAGVEGNYIKAMYLLERCLEDELGKSLPVNISAAIAAVLAEAGLPARAFRGFILTARCAGLAGHLVEELENPVGDELWEGAVSAVRYEKDGK